MKKILTLAFVALLCVPSTLATAQDDIYFSKKSTSKKAIYAETAADVWETNANNDWDIDTYNRRGPAPSDVTEKNDTYTSSYKGSFDDNGNLQLVRDTVVKLVEVRVIDSPYYWSSRIWRFHSPLFYAHHWDPVFDLAFYDPWYDPFYYGGSWAFTWGWGGISWGLGWFDPFYYGSYYHGYNHGYYHGYFDGFHTGYYAHGHVQHHHHNGANFAHHNRQRSAAGPAYTRNRQLNGTARPLNEGSSFALRGGNTRANASGRNISGGNRTTRSTVEGGNRTITRNGSANVGSGRVTQNSDNSRSINRSTNSQRASSTTQRSSGSSSTQRSSVSSQRSSSSSSVSSSSRSSVSSSHSSGGSRSFGGGGGFSGGSHSSGGSRGGGGRR